MAPPLRVTLDQAAKAELDRRYQTTRDATTRTRYQMVLLRAEGHPVVEVAQLTRCSPDTVRRVLVMHVVPISAVGIRASNAFDDISRNALKLPMMSGPQGRDFRISYDGL